MTSTALPEHSAQAPDWLVPDSDPRSLYRLFCDRRGLDDATLAQIEDDSHAQLKDMVPMIEALDQIRAQGLAITIAPDFDMDGIASGILGYAGLSELGFNVHLQIPDYRRGHELSVADIDEIAAVFPDTAVLMTCDGGINSHEGLHAASAKGWITLVTDHHQELEPGCPADITVDPCRLDETYAHPAICGAAVLYQVLEAYTARFAPHKAWQISMLQVFAGLGTVSDVMPVLYENRSYVRNAVAVASLLRAPAPKSITDSWGQLQPDYTKIDPKNSILLQILDQYDPHPVYRRAFLGFAVLLKAFGVAGKLRQDNTLAEDFFGFYLAPAMNSPRRIQTQIAPCFQVFTAADEQAMLEAAETVIDYSVTRREMTDSYLTEILDKDADQPYAPWIWFSAAPTGMQGLLANQLMHRTGTPAVVMQRPRDDSQPIGGSGRAPEWFDIIDVLAPIKGMNAIGHQQACGVKLERAELLESLADTLAATTAALRAANAESSERIGDLRIGDGPDIDARLEDTELLVDFAQRVNNLKPFGHGFEAPVVELVAAASGLRVDRIGSQSQHLRLSTSGGLKMLWWNAAELHYEQLSASIAAAGADTALRFKVAIQTNEFRGSITPQAVIASRLEDTVL